MGRKIILFLCMLVFPSIGIFAQVNAEVSKKIQRIPRWAIKIFLPDIPQPDEYSCGACSTMSVAKYYGLGPDSLEEFKKELDTKPGDGTRHRNIIAYLNKLGLKAYRQDGMSKRDLKKLLRRKIPVILNIQAYADDPKVYDDRNNNDWGHFLVAIGYDSDDNFYFMDSGVQGCRGYLPWNELAKRWHQDVGYETGGVNIIRYGIVVEPNGHKPVSRRRAQLVE